MTLRSGDSIDSYSPVLPFDPTLDTVCDDYLDRFANGLNYLNAASWRHYLPVFGTFALMHKPEGSNAIGALIASLRPPDREPPRLSSLSPTEEDVIRQLLEVLAFAECRIASRRMLPSRAVASPEMLPVRVHATMMSSEEGRHP